MKVFRNFLYVFLWIGLSLGADEPTVVYLTWTEDPTSTMTIQWHSPSETTAIPQISYHLLEDSRWTQRQGESQTVVDTDVDVHRIHLDGLNEDSVYVFKLQGSGKEYRFRTLPKKLSRPVRMAIGGDAFLSKGMGTFHRMSQVIAATDPDFIVIGGDLAYTSGSKNMLKGRKWAITRWQTFLKELQQTLSREDGRLVPLLPIVGNHDVTKPKHHTDKPEMFYEIFTFPEAKKAFRTLDFGNYLSLIMLDTGHTWPIEGEQTTWLEKSLQQSQSTYVFAAYHVAAYPSYYPYTDKTPEKLRRYWVPLFEKYHLPLAFEHHNHTFKRSHPIKEGKIDPEGVIYLGDGSWGVPPRRPASIDKLWYLVKSQPINMVYIVTMTQDKCRVEAKDIKGRLIDLLEARREALAYP